MKIAVMGAGGFLGSHLVERLIADPYIHVRAVDISDDKLDGIDGDNLDFQKIDVGADIDILEHLVSGADLVIDLVAYANPSLYVQAPLDVFDVNFMKNLEIVRLCVR